MHDRAWQSHLKTYYSWEVIIKRIRTEAVNFAIVVRNGAVERKEHKVYWGELVLSWSEQAFGECKHDEGYHEWHNASDLELEVRVRKTEAGECLDGCQKLAWR